MKFLFQEEDIGRAFRLVRSQNARPYLEFDPEILIGVYSPMTMNGAQKNGFVEPLVNTV
jgi:hypothetical protein